MSRPSNKNSRDFCILAIETSCDETAIAILKKEADQLTLLSNEVSSQVKLHAKWGGVVPNLAAREHVKNIEPILNASLKNANLTLQDIDMLAVTNGPGLIPALLVGVNFAKTLSYLWQKPLLGIHHIEGHIYANFISATDTTKKHFSNMSVRSGLSNTKFPALCLVVSGGHTQLVFMKDHISYEIIGQTLDDAVGEAFDKVARILNIGYPGGPAVAANAAEFQISNFEFRNKKNPKLTASEDIGYQLTLPRPMINKPGYNFSFSGLKTAVLYEVKKFQGGSTSKMEVEPPKALPQDYIAEMCHEFQQAAVDVLISKTLKAAKQFEPNTIMLAGGVSANKELREQFGKSIQAKFPHIKYQIPDLSLTGDNAAMIAAAAAFRWEKMTSEEKKPALDGWKKIQADANLKLK